MNYYVQRYKKHRNDGFNPLEAFGIVAAGIAAYGSIEDLRAVEKVRWDDSVKILDESEEFENESITRSISAV